MLTLTRSVGETIRIGDDIEIHVVEVRGGTVRLGFKAPREVAIHREEVYRQIAEANLLAAQVTADTLGALAAFAPTARPQLHVDHHGLRLAGLVAGHRSGECVACQFDRPLSLAWGEICRMHAANGAHNSLCRRSCQGKGSAIVACVVPDPPCAAVRLARSAERHPAVAVKFCQSSGRVARAVPSSGAPVPSTPAPTGSDPGSAVGANAARAPSVSAVT